MELQRIAKVQVACECGSCDIRISDANSDDYETVGCYDTTTQYFSEIEVECLTDECSVRYARASDVGFGWE